MTKRRTDDEARSEGLRDIFEEGGRVLSDWHRTGYYLKYLFDDLLTIIMQRCRKVEARWNTGSATLFFFHYPFGLGDTD